MSEPTEGVKPLKILVSSQAGDRLECHGHFYITGSPEDLRSVARSILEWEPSEGCSLACLTVSGNDAQRALEQREREREVEENILARADAIRARRAAEARG